MENKKEGYAPHQLDFGRRSMSNIPRQQAPKRFWRVAPWRGLGYGQTVTLAEALKTCRGVGPGFFFLRHALAVIILTYHCEVAVFGTHANNYALKGAAMSVTVATQLSRSQLIIELLRPGVFALVGMFFGLSGFLVVGSALRNSSIKVFFANRALRILPALTVEVTLSALILGPMVTAVPLATYFSDPQFFRYFGNIVGHITFHLPGVFETNPWPAWVNANLWTLPAEFWCYFLMLAMMVTGLVAHRKRTTVAVLSSAAAILLLSFYDPSMLPIREGTAHYTSWYIVLMFFYGVVFFINAERIPISPRLFALSALSYYVLTILDFAGPLSGLFLTYCMVWLGMQRFDWFDRVLRKDLSYGIYLYGFPITQAVIFFLEPQMSHLSSAARFIAVFPLALGLTLLFAAVSWKYVEEPALRLKKRLVKEQRARLASSVTS
jgi:peptidoglycan/LPS O-acetylase OafA/YrhL